MIADLAHDRVSMAAGVAVHRLGRMAYDEALSHQERLQAAVLDGGPEALLLVEHWPVVTLGRGADARHVLRPDFPIRRVGRGGDATYHGPGQLVGYPILDLERRGRDLHRYLRELEEVLIRAAASLGVRADRRPPYTGVWIGTDKLAAIGVGVRRWVTLHGFALNVADDLRHAFATIVPCGLVGTGVTSLETILGRRPALLEVEAAVVRAFAAVFAVSS